jgi:uncharacterized protein (DUF58 family)
MNQKSIFLTLFSLAIFLIALAAKNGTIALFALPVLVYLFTGIWLSPTKIELTASRQIEKTNENNDQNFTQKLTLTNQGAQPICLQISDAVFPDMNVQNGELQQSLQLTASDTFTLNYQFSLLRGCHTWKNTHVIVSDPLQVYQQHILLPAIASVTVKPQVSQLQHIPLHPRKTLHMTGNIPARIAGSGTDIWGVRQYQTGDQLRRINWQKIARNPGQLYTNEFEQEEISDIGLILDARSLGNHPSMETELLERNIQAVASLADRFLREGNRVGLLIFGSKLVHLFPGYGKNQLNKVLFNLALVEQRPYISLNQLQYLPFRLFPARAQIIMVSAYNRNDIEGYKRLRAYGYPLMLLSPDPFSDNAAYTNPILELSYQAAQAERQMQLEKLARLGVRVINWTGEQSLNSALQSGLHQIGHHHSRGGLS